MESTYTGNVSHEFFRIAKGTGYKSSELESLQEGNTLCIGGKEIEVKRNFMACNINHSKILNLGLGSGVLSQNVLSSLGY